MRSPATWLLFVCVVLAVGAVVSVRPVFAGMDRASHRTGPASEKCSPGIEGLKLCVENPKFSVNLGVPVRIKLRWVNSTDEDRRIGTRRDGYAVTVTDGKGEKMIPVFEQRLIEWRERMRTSGEEDKGIIFRAFGGSDRGLHVPANGIEPDEITLTNKWYDYDLSAKRNYRVTVSKRVESKEKGKTIEFVLEDIEIQVR